MVRLDHTTQVSQGEGEAALNLVFQTSGLQFSLAVVCIFDLTFFQICSLDCSPKQGYTGPGGEAHPCQPKSLKFYPTPACLQFPSYLTLTSPPSLASLSAHECLSFVPSLRGCQYSHPHPCLCLWPITPPSCCFPRSIPPPLSAKGTKNERK